MELDKEKIIERLRAIDEILYVPPEGRLGGSWEKKYEDERKILNILLQLEK